MSSGGPWLLALALDEDGRQQRVRGQTGHQ
eukprot:COSAG01_NODE_72310_length_253_cov_0.850649_1_plen_29_part_10